MPQRKTNTRILMRCAASAALVVATAAWMPDTLEIQRAEIQKAEIQRAEIQRAEEQKTEPECVHPPLGTKATSADRTVTLTLINRRQSYAPEETRTYDRAIRSPKSINVHPSGRKVYVNSLEGATTVVYALPDLNRLSQVSHRFDDFDAALWAAPSGLYEFTHYPDGASMPFSGKPVESVFTHQGRYLWVPYYRRSFDINAQDPSALAVIDTSTDQIVRMFETGALPKMIAAAPDGKTVAISHWGENTVGLIDVSSADPRRWKHRCCVTIDYKLNLDYSLTESVDRDTGSGYSLRGTVFTPDSRYVLVGAMGGGGGIAVIDCATGEYLGRIMGMMGNMRHLLIHGDYLYLSINRSGYVQRCRLSDIYAAINSFNNHLSSISTWESAKVAPGARTIVISPDGRYVYAACNSASAVCVLDTHTMKCILQIPTDSYPVGMAISTRGRHLFVTSQGRNYKGGNCVNVFRIDN